MQLTGPSFAQRLLAAAVSCVLSLGTMRSYAQTSHPFDITLTPLTSEQHEVTSIRVDETIDGDPTDGKAPFSLSAPIFYFMLSHIADLQVTDTHGSVELSVTDDSPAGQPLKAYRHWQAKRSVVFPVRVSYVAAVEPNSSHSGPPYGMKSAGVAGSGGGFLLLPDDGWTDSIHLHWDLSHFPARSIGVISAGRADVTLAGKPSLLIDQWMLAGPAQVFHEPGPVDFTGYVLEASFDGATEIAWAAGDYFFLGDTFRYLQPLPPYPVFVRVLDVPPYDTGTTMGLGSGFLMHIDNDPTAVHRHNGVHYVMFHEMTHQWLGQNATEESWFAEGMTVYYSLVLPLRGNLESVDDFVQALNELAAKYYTNPARNWTDDKIRAARFGNEQVRQTPYERGCFYFAVLDARIREKSHGHRRLEDVLYPLFVARKNGSPITQAVWEAMLRRELGEQAVAEFRSVIVDATDTVVPSQNTFGRCFSRQTVALDGLAERM